MRGLRKIHRDTCAAQIMEFAVVLPLLAVLIVGIFDFGQAFSIRQKLTFAARDAARFGSSQPTNDLTQATPISVSAIRDLVDADLISAGLNDCGLGTITQAGTVAWSASGTCPSSATFTLTIDRGYVAPPLGQPGINIPGAGEPLRLISTHVTMSYPYQWHFNSVIRLLVPSATYAGITQITTDAIAPNQD
jgi:Flp pilus assembly protein TadG